MSYRRRDMAAADAAAARQRHQAEGDPKGKPPLIREGTKGSAIPSGEELYRPRTDGDDPLLPMSRADLPDDYTY